MINKKLEITLGGEKRQLWFNNFAVFELQKMFGVQQGDVLKSVMERAEDNYLLLVSDLIKAGLKGYAYANDQGAPDTSKLNTLIADGDLTELLQVWEVFFEHMGGNVEKEEVKKKAAPKKQRARKKS